MCGIVYVKRKDGKPAKRSVRKRYHKQSARGTSGFGYVAIKDNEVVSYQRAPTEHEIMLKLDKEDAPEILFHHRFPTSTPNMEEQAHPLYVEGPGLGFQYFIAHNGVIRNSLTRKEEHEKLGFKYLTELKSMVQTVTQKLYNYGGTKFNDSEALAVDTALAMEGKTRYIEAEGPAAVVGLKLQGKKVVERFFYRNNGNPLKYHSDKMMTSITSMGVGADVDPVNVQRLKEDGTVEESNLWTPWVYRTTPITKVYGDGRYDYEDEYAWPYGNDVNHKVLPSLPPAPPAKEPPIELSYEYTGGPTDEEYEGEEDALLGSLPIESLWDEWDKLSNVKKGIEAALEAYGTKTSEVGLVTLPMFDAIDKLNKQAAKVKVYEMRITAELIRRERKGEVALIGETNNVD